MSVSVPPRASLVPGYRLDRYELLCPIAEGGMAAVWLAWQHGKHGFRKLVAIKTILPKFVAESGFQQMFLDESRIASRIEHANVAQILDVGEEHGVLYMVMEWVDGDALLKIEKALAKTGTRFPPSILLRILCDACLGLHEAHELCDEHGHSLGVVHRDVSPQNLLVGREGVTKLIDFGIVKARDRALRETTSGMVKGKLHYMAPEQALGQRVDRRADIWAIAAVFYRIMIGRPPYDASNPVLTMKLLAEGRLLTPLTSACGVDPAVCDVMSIAMSPDPGGRFETAKELHDALEAAMAVGPGYATTADVASFLANHNRERSAARKQAIQVATEAAIARANLASIVREPTLSSSSMIVVAEDVRSGPVSEAPTEPLRARDTRGDTLPTATGRLLRSGKALSPRGAAGQTEFDVPLESIFVANAPTPAPRRALGAMRGPLPILGAAGLTLAIATIWLAPAATPPPMAGAPPLEKTVAETATKSLEGQRLSDPAPSQSVPLPAPAPPTASPRRPASRGAAPTQPSKAKGATPQAVVSPPPPSAEASPKKSLEDQDGI